MARRRDVAALDHLDSVPESARVVVLPPATDDEPAPDPVTVLAAVLERGGAIAFTDITGRLEVAQLPAGASIFPLYLDGGRTAWGDRTYAVRAAVENADAWYVCIQSTAGQPAAVTEPGAGSDWESYWSQLGGAAADAVARAAAAAARAKADRNEELIDTLGDLVSLLQSVTRDLHDNTDAPEWALADDARIDYVLDDDYSSGTYQSNKVTPPDGGWPATFAAQGKGWIFIRVPQGADISDYRMTRTDESGDQHFTSFHHEAETPEDSTHDYYRVNSDAGDPEFGRFTSFILSIAVEKHVHPSDTLYDGDLGAGIVSLGALANAVLARMLPATNAQEAGRIVQVDSAGVWISTPVEWGLSDLAAEVLARMAPALADQGGKFLAVKSDATAVEAVAAPSGDASPVDATAESITFANVADGSTAGDADHELEVNVSDPTTVHGAGGILSGVTDGSADFTVKAGVYLVELSGSFRGQDRRSAGSFVIRKASDDSNLTTRSALVTTDTQTLTGAIYEVLFLNSDTEVNVLYTAVRGTGLRGARLTLVSLQGAVAPGDGAGVTLQQVQEVVEAHDHVIDPLDELTDELAAAIPEGDVVLYNQALYQVRATAEANTFSGVLALLEEGNFRYLASTRQDSSFGAIGRFTANPDNVVGTVLVGVNTTALEVRVNASAYSTAKGSDVADGDEISVAFTGEVDDSAVTTTHTLAYRRQFTVGDRTWLSFEGDGTGSVLRQLGVDGAWSMIVSQGGDPLFTHGAAVKHFVDYPLRGVDHYARDVADEAKTTAEGALPRSGGTMTGGLTLAGDPVNDLHAATKEYVDDSVDAVSSSDLIVAGLREEQIAFVSTPQGSANVELAPTATDPVSVVEGTGDPVLITGVSGNDFTVAAGLYLVQISGEISAGGVRKSAFRIRDASDDSELALFGPHGTPATTTDEPFALAGYWNNPVAVAVNIEAEKYGRTFIVSDFVMKLSRLDTLDDQVNLLRPLEPIDEDVGEEGDVILSDHEFFVKAKTGTVNGFAGVLEEWQEGPDTYTGTTARNSVDGQHGRFTDNHGMDIVELIGGKGGTDFVVLGILKSAYDTAIGRAVRAGDQLKAVITGTVNGTSTTTTSTLTYATTHGSGDTEYYVFSVSHAASVLHQLADGAAWTLGVNRTNDTPLLTHGEDIEHYVEYPIQGAVDQAARDQIQREKERADLGIDEARYPRSEVFTIPQSDGVAQFDPLVLAALGSTSHRGDHLVAHFFGDVDPVHNDPIVHGGVRGIAIEDAASGSVKMLTWGLVTQVPVHPQYTHAQLQTRADWAVGKPIYCTTRANRQKQGGSSDNLRSGDTYWSLDPNDSYDDQVYGYVVWWEGASGTNQQGVYDVIFDFRRLAYQD
ncbi:MAG: hypothetical protein F4107_08620 [Gemmatimonadetes bacterium]|nr:hypothetical protein [Gemmatimonadota bacterium]MYD13961.1 hypothetical protein [Gemmatimonadota bacterium]MYI65980.1 hypothetical protein [Gemmatimonadota bacterium]